MTASTASPAVTGSLTEALWYVTERGWPVLPAATDGGEIEWPEPVAPSRDTETVTSWWRRWPTAGVMLAAGLEFDVIRVPATAGRAALARLLRYGAPAIAPGPVAVREDEYCEFYVAPGGSDDLGQLLEWLDWGGITLNIRGHGAGELVDAPAAPVTGQPPSRSSSGWLHDPLARPPELIALLATIAEACHRLVIRGESSAATRRRS